MSEDRRKFLRRGGILGAFFAGATTPVLAERVREIHIRQEKPTVDPEVKQQIEEFANEGILELHKTYGEIKQETSPINSSNLYVFHKKTNIVPGTEKPVKLGMCVGPDGELYLRVNDEWKKVLTT